MPPSYGAQTSGNWLSTNEIQRWTFYTSCCHRRRSSGIRGTPIFFSSIETTGIKHLKCCLCCARRLATSQAFALAYSRSTSSVLSNTLAVLGCRVASSPTDVDDLCLWIQALRQRSSALPYVTGAVSCPEKGHVARRRTLWDATQLVRHLLLN